MPSSLEVECDPSRFKSSGSLEVVKVAVLRPMGTTGEGPTSDVAGSEGPQGLDGGPS
jgi:hypothetical protein